MGGTFPLGGGGPPGGAWVALPVGAGGGAWAFADGGGEFIVAADSPLTRWPLTWAPSEAVFGSGADASAIGVTKQFYNIFISLDTRRFHDFFPRPDNKLGDSVVFSLIFVLNKVLLGSTGS